MAKSVAKNAVYSGIRTISMMLFPLITYPYVTRVLLPENLGKIDFSVSIVSYFLLIAALGITTYATREGARIRDDRAALDAFASEVFTINMASTAVAYILLVALVVLWPHLHGYLSLIAIQSLTIIGTTLGVEWVYGLEEDYGYITLRTILVQVISAILLFTLVHKPSDYVLYAAITAFASVGGNIFNWLRSKRYVTVRLVWNFDYRRHLVPMLVLFGNAIAVTIYVNIDVSLLNVMRGDYEVGIYGLSVKIYKMVKQLLNAIVTVSLPRLSLYVGRKDGGSFQSLLTNVAHGLLATLVPALTLLFLMAEDVVLIVGGNTYLESIPSLRILCLACVFAVAGNYFVNAILLPHGLERFALRSTIVGAVINFALNLPLIPLFGVTGAAATTVIAEACVVMVAIWYARGCTNLATLAKDTAPAVLNSLLGMVVMVALYAPLASLPLPWLTSFLVRGATLSVAYVIVLLFRKDALALAALRTLTGRLARPGR